MTHDMTHDMTAGLTKMKMMDISEMLFRDDGILVTDINSFFCSYASTNFKRSPAG